MRLEKGEDKASTIGLILIGLSIFFLAWAALSPPLRKMADAGYSSISPELRARKEKLLCDVASGLQIPAKLLTAMAEVESGFDEKAVSSKGAHGILQVKPDTALEIAFEYKLGPRHLSDVRDNAIIGGLYLKKLIARYHNDLALALAAYNAGPARVDQWVKRGKGMTGVEIVRKYAFRETRQYVKDVMGKAGMCDDVSETKAIPAVSGNSSAPYAVPDRINGTSVVVQAPGPAVAQPGSE